MKKGVNLILTAIRYVFLLIAAFMIQFIYLGLKPITIFPVFFILKSIYNNLASLDFSSSIIIINNKVIELAEPCIAGAAYLLLIILNFSIPMPVKKRIYSMIFCIFAFLIINILRIIIFSMLYANDFKFFSSMHMIFWYLMSIVFVALIWFLSVFIFKIKGIPFYEDIKNILKQTNLLKKNDRKNY